MPLIDGTIVRLPGMRVDDRAGKIVEQAPRQAVKRAVGESYSGAMPNSTRSWRN